MTKIRRFADLSGPQVRDLLTERSILVQPMGAIEQHGPHLPLDVDVFLAESVCLEVGRRAPDKVLVLPPVSYGLK